MAPTDPDVREEIRRTVREFVRREVEAVVAELEHADEYPTHLVEGMRDLGLFGITIPEEHGGLGLGVLTYVGVVEELCASSAATATRRSCSSAKGRTRSSASSSPAGSSRAWATPTEARPDGAGGGRRPRRRRL